MILPCISIRQPWAWLILHGGKDIENRSWNTKVRGLVLIHAAKGFTSAEYDDAVSYVDTDVDSDLAERIPSPSEIKLGGIVGAAILSSVAQPGTDAGPWHTGEWGFVLARPTVLPFRSYKGALGFFQVEVTFDEARRLREAGLL